MLSLSRHLGITETFAEQSSEFQQSVSVHVSDLGRRQELLPLEFIRGRQERKA